MTSALDSFDICIFLKLDILYMIALIDSQLLTHPFTALDVHKDGFPSPPCDDLFESVGIAYLGGAQIKFQGSTCIN